MLRLDTMHRKKCLIDTRPPLGYNKLTDTKEREPMLFLQYPPCSTCQKAKKWLDEHGIVYTARHIKEDNPTADELRAWIAASGLPIKRFFNTSGLVYKNLGLKDKLPAMSEEEQIALLASDGMLVKRPLLVADGFVLPGFKPAEWEKALL
jgi:arsenate reductase